MDLTRNVVSAQYTHAVKFALGVQIVVGFIARVTLDGGHLARTVGIAALASWLGTAMLMARRPHAPTRGDLLWVQWGFWPTLLAVMFGGGLR